MNEEFYRKSIASLLEQVYKLKEKVDFYKEQSEDYKNAYINAIYDIKKAETYSTKLETDIELTYGQIHNLEQDVKNLKEKNRVLAQENSTLIKNFLQSKKEEKQDENEFDSWWKLQGVLVNK